MVKKQQAQQYVPIGDALTAFSKIILQSTEKEGVFDADMRLKYRPNPDGFVRDILGGEPTPYHETILASVRDNDRTTVRSGNSLGKTWIAGAVALWFESCFEPSTVVTTAPTDRQVKNLLWKEIHAQYHKAKYNLGGRLITKDWIMDEKRKWFGIGFSTNEYNIDAFQGFHNDNVLVIVDESCGVATNIFNAIEGLISSGQTVRLLLIGNPNNENTKFGDSHKDPTYEKIHLSAFDCPNFTKFGITLEDIRTTRIHPQTKQLVGTWSDKIKCKLPFPNLVSPRWVADRWLAWGEDSPLWQVRVMGNFPREDAYTLFPLAWVERAEEQEFEEIGPITLGADIAREGDDDSVIATSQNNVVKIVRKWNGFDTMHTTGLIKANIDELGVQRVNLDCVGLGAGVLDRLHEQGLRDIVAGINGGERSNFPDKFFNLRSELFWNLRTKLESGQVQLPKDSELERQLCSFKGKYTSKGQFQLERKEETKKLAGRSPDVADAVVLALYETPERYSNVGLEDVFTDEIQEKRKSLEIFNLPQLSYNNNSRICTDCNTAAGLVYFDDDGIASPANAKYIKCLICQKKWEGEKCQAP